MQPTPTAWLLRALVLSAAASALLARPLLAQPGIQINDVTVTEGNTGQLDATFTVTLTAPSANPVSVAFVVEPITATGGAGCGGAVDFRQASGTLQFAPGTTSQSLVVKVCGDVVDEPDETFQVRLSNPTNAVLQDDRGQGTIIDNDGAAAPLPTVSIGDATAVEGNNTGAATTSSLAVTLSASSTQAVTVTFASSPTTTTQGASCVSNVDHLSAAGTLTFNPGVTTQSISLSICGDTVDEPNETFAVVLSSPSGATLGDAQGLVTITDDDPAAALPTVSIDDVSFPEGNTLTTTRNATVRLSATTTQTVTVTMAVLPGGTASGGNCSLGDDFAAFLPRTLTINPGQTVLTTSFSICGLSAVEPDETFTLELRSPVNATLGDSVGQVTILNDDLRTLSITRNIEVDEPNSGQVPAPFIVTLSAPETQTVTVRFATVPGTASAGSGCNVREAAARGDYVTQTGTLTFSPGQTTQQIPVSICSDGLSEPDETFTVTLSGPANATIASAVGRATIKD